MIISVMPSMTKTWSLSRFWKIILFKKLPSFCYNQHVTNIVTVKKRRNFKKKEGNGNTNKSKTEDEK